MEVLSASKRQGAASIRSLSLIAAVALLWLTVPLDASAGEALDATIKDRLKKTGAISICDVDLERSVGRDVEVYGNVFETRASGFLMSDPRCQSVVVGVEPRLPYIPADLLRGHTSKLELYWASRKPLTSGTLFYCTCGGTIRRTTVPGKFYIEMLYAKDGAWLPIQDAPAYPSRIVLEDGRVVPGPEFLIPRALKRVTEKEWFAADRPPGFVPPPPW